MNISCSTDGSDISSTMKLTDGSPLPNWIQYSSTNDVLSWQAPTTLKSNQISLMYCVTDSLLAHKTGCTPVTLNVIPSTESTTNQGSSSKSQSNSNISKASELTLTTIASVGAIVILSVCMGAFNLSSMTVVWMVFGQIKICQILLLQDGYISESVKTHILGFKLSLLSFSFIDFKDKIFISLPWIGTFIKYIDYDQDNSKIRDLGYNSGSAFVNNINFFTTLFLTVVLYIVICIFNKTLIKVFKLSVENKLMKILIKVQHSFVLGAYIRLQIETFQGIFITSISEIIKLNTISTPKIISLSLCSIILLIEIIIWLIFCFLWCSLRRDINSKEFKNYLCINYNDWFDEVKKDLKEKFLSKGYYFIDITRILLFASMTMKNQIYEIAFIQFIYLILMIILRPFTKIHHNIIKIQNECYFMFFIVYVGYFNTQAYWESSTSPFTILSKMGTLNPFESLFIILMTSNCVFTFIILLTTLFVLAIKKLCSSNRITPKPVSAPFNHVPSVSISIVEESKLESNHPKSTKNDLGKDKTQRKMKMNR